MVTWTDPVDRADGYVVGQTVWNQNLGDTGNLQYLYDRLAVKYMTATHVISASTTYVDLITSGAGTMSFSVVANGIYIAQYVLLVTPAGTGGLKLQLTGPAAPTGVYAQAFGEVQPLTGDNAALGSTSAPAAAFSAALFSANAGSTTGLIKASAGTVVAYATIINGANAGTVTLQGAQNSANTTTTFGIGSRMEVFRVA